MGAENRPNHKPEIALKLKKQGVSASDIGERLGVSRLHVYWLLKEAHRRLIENPPAPPRF